jgi:chitodextrinase
MASAAFDSTLTRYPYLTDVTTSSVQVNWADTFKSTYGTVTWGTAGSGCGTSSLKGTKLGASFTVATTTEYQHAITISGLTPGTAYCYRVKGGTTSSVDLLGTDSSPTFTTLPTAGSYSFLTFGDWGDTSAGPNVNQAKLNVLMASSNALFAVGTGDIAYPSGNQAQYGDLVNTGTSVSQVFGPDYWRAPGAVLPYFSTPGNHGRTTTFFQNWPEPAATAEPGESYGVINYPASPSLGYSASTGPAAWYAFDVAGTRFYVLTADWSDTNTGSADGTLCSAQFAGATCPDYQAEQDAHWKPGNAEYEWLKTDLATHSGLKLAFFHYPLRSDDFTEPSDPYLQDSPLNPDRATSLERMLVTNGVKLAFNGHAHIYQRNIAPPNGIVSYVTGGGGAKLVPIAKGSVSSCSTTDAYGLGWSSTGGSYCGNAGTKPTSDSKVFHFLKVTVSGTNVTVTPTNADGETFDQVTYDFGADSTNPTAPGTVQATFVNGTKPSASVTWTAGSDSGSGVAAYDIYRLDPGNSTRTYLATVGPNKTSYSDATAAAGTAYTYSVDTRDQAGNVATGTAAPLGDVTPPSAPSNLQGASSGQTGATLSWTASTDNVGVTGYRIYRNGSQVGTPTTQTSYNDTGLAAATTYAYTVKAVDAAGNLSPASTTVSVTTDPPTGGTTSTFIATDDTTIDASLPDKNVGTATRVIADGSPVNQGLFKFNVTAGCSSVQSAKLTLTVGTSTDDKSGKGGDVHAAGSGWNESTATYNNAASLVSSAVLGSFPGTSPGVELGTSYTVDVTPAVTGDGPVSFGLTTARSDAARYFSIQGTAIAAQQPHLTVVCAAGGGGGDTTPPSVPTGLTATASSSTSVALSWTAATDNVGVTGYDVFRGSTQIKQGATGTSFTDSTAAASTTYSYTVKARDAAGNVSAASTAATVTTPPAGGSTTATFAPTSDARVEQATPTANFGTSSTLSADQSSTAQIESYLMFNVTGLTGPVTSAKLRVWTTTGSTSPSTNGPAVSGVADSSWTEAGLTWNNRPTGGASVDNAGALTADTMVEYNVTPLVTGNGTISLKLTPDSTDGTSFNSRQGSDSTKRPQLVITTS